MADREADKMTLWQCSQEEASSHARGRDGGTDKQMLFITQGWWGFSVCGPVWVYMSVCLRSHKVEVVHECVWVSLYVTVCLSACDNVCVSVCMCKSVFQHPQSAWGRGTYKRHLARRAKTTKVTLPLVMYSVFSHCSWGKCDICGVWTCVLESFDGWTFLCLCLSATLKVMLRCQK